MKEQNDIWKDLINISDSETRKNHDVINTCCIPSDYIRYLLYGKDDELDAEEKKAINAFKETIIAKYKARGLDVYFTYNRDNNKFHGSNTFFGWSERAIIVDIAKLNHQNKEQ